MTAIRLAPSGPVIANSGGAPLDPGPGMTMRKSLLVFPFIEASQSDALTGDDYELGQESALPGTAVVASLTDCDPNAFYDIRAEFDVTNGDETTNGVLEVDLETSPDAVTWTARASTEHIVGSGGGGVGARRIVAQMAPTLGSALGVAALTPDLHVRAIMRAPSGASIRVYSAGGTAGTSTLQLVESF